MSKPFENKLALFAGSSCGIGAAKITNTGGHAEAVQADLGGADKTKALANAGNTVFGGKFGGRVDILVNNVGTAGAGAITRLSRPIARWDREKYMSIFSVIYAADDSVLLLKLISNWRSALRMLIRLTEAAVECKETLMECEYQKCVSLQHH
jgi:3-oxoacyl-[acyl-carrier protein] reductase